MLVLTQEQLDLIGEQRWEDEMLRELRTFAPKLYEIRGPQTFRQFIRAGCARAKTHGFTHRGPVRFFLQTMVSLGHHFDQDPQFPSFTAALGDPQAPQKPRAQALFGAVSDTFDRVLGPECEHAITALARLRDAQSVWGASVPASAEGLVEHMLADMHQIFPQKAQHVGDPTLRQLVETAIERAEGHGLPPIAGGRVLAALMFALGFGITTDPLYPWVCAMLERRATQPTYDRAQHLAAQARIYLTATLDHLSQDA